MSSNALTSIPEPSNLVLDEPLPLTMHPAAVYLASLGVGSRRTMREALNVISGLLTDGTCDAMTLNWAALRYTHTAAVRSVLMEKYSPAMANKMLCALRRTLKEARRLGLMSAEDYDRAVDIASVRGTSLLRGRALQKEEITALMSVCISDSTNTGIRDAALLSILMVGLRRSEVVNLDLSDFNARTRGLTIRGAKGKKDRSNYLPVWGVEAVQDWLKVRGYEPGPLLYPLNKARRIIPRRMSEQAVMSALQKRGQQAGIASFSPHDLRRTFISDLLDAGVDLVTVSQLAGHASPSTTSKYDRRGEEAKKRAIDRLNVPYKSREIR
ncbi:tyrosine-type recombinase/integrase [Gloeothece verrucosa]|uniref:Integrase family protein n=1 Tax=Gloeothece verrucosa (strain PCC 7822) TaxID=497965 RepID=E0UNY7_GLOV7|nr:site-specific integrase [Gloeothece verrucosa]ADN18667.1 integrase family protein [Gloeothece verrucosa PCC 7822]